jgi:peptidyl-tRNA hydrolase
MKKDFAPLLLGGGLRSIARSSDVVRVIDDQADFDALFTLLLHHERLLVMRAADAIEKVTLARPAFLSVHKQQLMSLLKSALHKELKWHIALLIARIDLNADELKEVWDVLSYWLHNPNESKIVRVNSLQGLYELSKKHSELKGSFEQIVQAIRHEPVPSLQARIRMLRKK